jgi:hypothetical protein
MNARFLRDAKLRDLVSNIEANLALYRSGSFDFVSNDPDYFFESDIEISEDLLASVSCSAGDLNEVDSCIKMYRGIGDISEYLARDERLWVYLTHTLLLPYTRTRWPIPEDNAQAVKHIRTHFFCFGARGIERNNAASRLWWMALLCSRCKSLDLHDSLTCFLYQSDVRANIVERPTISQNVEIFNLLIANLDSSLKGDLSLYDRGNFRRFMKSLNLRGGVKLLAALPDTVVNELISDCISSAKSEN